MSVIAPLRIHHSTWSVQESAVFSALSNITRMWVTGGWVRDKVLACTDVNPPANTAWQRLRGLTGCPTGDVDLLVDGMTAQEFRKACRLSTSLMSELHAPPILVRARGGRSLDTVKLRLAECSIDATSLLDARKNLGLPYRDIEQSIESSLSRRHLLEVDAAHRDTTFNALYYELETEQVLDPSTKGLMDLRDGIVRSPHSSGAMASVREDPLRLLRAFRFSARFSFELDSAFLEGLDEDVVHLLEQVPHGRVLNEVKKALLIHNQPSRFLELLSGSCEVHRWLFSAAGSAVLDTWAAAVGRVRRLEALLFEGFRRQLLRSRSEQWRGRRADGPLPAMLTPDWRKTGVFENDWAELLLAALLWRCTAQGLAHLGKSLELSQQMVENIIGLQTQARHGLAAVQARPPGAHLLRAAATEGVTPSEFWDRWPRSTLPLD